MSLSRAREKLIRRLRTRKGRPREGLVLVEGPRAVRIALEVAGASGPPVRFVLAAPEAELSLPDGSDVEILRIPRAELEALADTESPQGLLAVVEEPASALPPPESARDLRLLVLDGIQDPGNAGTLIRSAAALGIDAVVALDGTVDPWNPKAVRASAGEAFRIPVVRLPWDAFRSWLQAAALPLLVADPAGRDVRRLPRPTGGWVLLVGSEGAGPRAEAREAASARVALPLTRSVESLNAAVAGSVLLWALAPVPSHFDSGTSP